MARRENFKLSLSERRRRTFSESFKIKKVQEIETGITKVSEICKAYEVSDVSVYNWLNKYGVLNKKKKERLIVESESDTQELLALRKRIADLERALGQKQLQLDFKEKMIDIAEDMYGVDIKKAYQSTIEYFWLHREEITCSLNQLYHSIGISKQGVHKMLNLRQKHRDENAQLARYIEDIRVDHPTMGLRDMYYKIKPEFMGRDKFEFFCKESGYSFKHKRNACKTTDSSGVKRFSNLIENLIINRANQVWQSDITYFEVGGRFYYITFILDSYTRRIVGYSVSKRLLTEHTTLPALKMAIRTRKGQDLRGLIFHSDGGGQYYAQDFLKITSKTGILNSMCKHAYENGKAERINGVIKNNYLVHWQINSFAQLTQKVDHAVLMYNHEKPHIKLDRNSPIQFENKLLHLQSINTTCLSESETAKVSSCKSIRDGEMLQVMTKQKRISLKIKCNNMTSNL